MTALPILRGSLLPFSYIQGFLALLKSIEKVRFLTHADLNVDPQGDISTEDGLKKLYRDEIIKWRKSRSGEHIDVNIRHDSDSGPDQTVYMCEYEAQIGVTSTTAVFNKVAKQGALVPYEIDIGRLVHTQDRGIRFSYHVNAGELVGYADNLVPERFNSDVDELIAQGLNIGFFSPHGGVAGPGGKNNNSYFYPAFSRRRLYWTHNRFAPYGSRYSDGGIVPRIKKFDPSTDLRSYLLNNLPGPDRHFFLLHPQYYFADTQGFARSLFDICPWLSEFWALHEAGRSDMFWDPVRELLIG